MHESPAPFGLANRFATSLFLIPGDEARARPVAVQTQELTPRALQKDILFHRNCGLKNVRSGG
jgi:hypothetical protein